MLQRVGCLPFSALRFLSPIVRAYTPIQHPHNIHPHLRRRNPMSKAFDRPPLPIDQILVKIPPGRFSRVPLAQLKHRVGTQRRSTEQRKGNLRKVRSDVFQYLRIRILFLVKIIARKCQHHESPGFVPVVQRKELEVIRFGQASFARHVDDQREESGVLHEGLGSSANVRDGVRHFQQIDKYRSNKKFQRMTKIEWQSGDKKAITVTTINY